MSRGNVFKLSGNMALNSGINGNPTNPYPSSNQYSGSNVDFSEIKNSLKLLKSKQRQQQQRWPSEEIPDSEQKFHSRPQHQYQGSSPGMGNYANDIHQNPYPEQISRGSCFIRQTGTTPTVGILTISLNPDTTVIPATNPNIT